MPVLLFLSSVEPDTAAECVDNQIIPVIFSFLSKMAQLNANESAIHFDKHICLALSILRTLLETVDAVSIGPMLTENNLLTLAACMNVGCVCVA